LQHPGSSVRKQERSTAAPEEWASAAGSHLSSKQLLPVIPAAAAEQLTLKQVCAMQPHPFALTHINDNHPHITTTHSSQPPKHHKIITASCSPGHPQKHAAMGANVLAKCCIC
jgi:hypothetical protein